MTGRQTIRQWIVECLSVSEKAELYGAKKCTGLSLVHVSGATKVELKTVKIGARSYDPKELASLFQGTADNFAGGVPGVQQFELLAFYDDGEQPQSFYPFRVAADPDHQGLATEGPTSTGITSQLMRHNEAVSRLGWHHTGEVFRVLERTIDRQDKRIEMLEKEQLDAIELAKELVLKQAADSHNRTIELLKLKQSAKDREAIMRILPPVINRVTGKEIFPQNMVDTAIFENMAETLDEAQIKQLATILKPEQWALVADRLVQALENKAKREEEEKKIEQGGNGTITTTTST